MQPESFDCRDILGLICIPKRGLNQVDRRGAVSISDSPANPGYLLTESYIGYRFRDK